MKLFNRIGVTRARMIRKLSLFLWAVYMTEIKKMVEKNEEKMFLCG